MIGLCLLLTQLVPLSPLRRDSEMRQVELLGSMNADFPQWEGEFDEYEEHLIPLPAIIAEQENRADLLALVSNSVHVPYISDSKIEKLLAPLIPKGSTVVDMGMGLSPFLSECAGKEGKVYAFESDLKAFSERYWQIVDKGGENISLYYSTLCERSHSLDEYGLDDVSLICIHCAGREDLFLKGATDTIERHKPALLVNLLGGLSMEGSDRFIKEELDRRIQEIVKKGYKVSQIRGDMHLAIPK